jgi:hypothetical protein
MNTDYITPAMAVISLVSSVILVLLYNRMDARYVQISTFRDAQERQVKDHEQRDKKLDDIHEELKSMGTVVNKIQGDIEFERGVRKGKAEK